MKFKILLAGSLVAMVTLYACKKSFLEKAPLGTLDESVLANNAGVQGLLIGAYSQLNGFGGANGGFYSGPSNWAFAGVASDDAYKGSDAGDQGNELNPIEAYTVTPTNVPVSQKWAAYYDGITRCNDVLRIMAKATDMTADDQKNVEAQARFLRAHYHFDLKRVFNNIPWVNESVTYAAGNYNVPNKDGNVWDSIENDFKYAIENLPETQDAVGRANKSAAKAYLGKVYMYEHKFQEARDLFENEVIPAKFGGSGNGRTSNDKPYDLVDFSDNFNAETENNAESVFAVQYSVNDGSGANKSGWDQVLNFPYNNGTNDMPGGCCGFYQPTQDLVDAYRVDAAGLPFLYTWFSKDVKNDQGLKSTDPFTPETDPLDPRLDLTVGRRGIPYLDWGVHPGQSWIRDQSNGGPYSPKKNVYYKRQTGKLTDASFWTSGVVATNYIIIRFADVLLMTAEAEVELNNLNRAKDLVNYVRDRAKTSTRATTNTALANYKIEPYTSFPDQTYARDAVRFERRLEFAMEGYRFFDLVRWDIAAETLNAYVAREKSRRTYLANASFTKGKNEYFPIPQAEIDLSQGTLVQNPGY